jgi:23S rRNA pseudouridine1911/1915/1917 synthase
MSGHGAGELDVEVPHSLDGQRLDRSIAMLTGLARAAVADLVAAGRARVDGAPVTTRSRQLAAGQRLQATWEAAGESTPAPDPAVHFTIVHEDDDLLVVDKPAGLVVHHGAGQHGATLVDGLLARYPELARLPDQGAGDPQRPGIVHRLDKGTSGLLVVARSVAAFESLSRQMREHTATRSYLALVVGRVEADEGVVDAPIGRSARDPARMAVRTGGRPARTAYRVRARYRTPVPATLLDVELETGRTHQVRVHLTAIGHPVVGDARYGAAKARPVALVATMAPGRVFLHAWRLSVQHPDGGRRTWESPLPADLVEVSAQLDV